MGTCYQSRRRKQRLSKVYLIQFICQRSNCLNILLYHCIRSCKSFISVGIFRETRVFGRFVCYIRLDGRVHASPGMLGTDGQSAPDRRKAISGAWKTTMQRFQWRRQRQRHRHRYRHRHRQKQKQRTKCEEDCCCCFSSKDVLI